MPNLLDIENSTTLDEALQAPRAILYKHSTRCPVSAYAFEEIRNFAKSHPTWTIYVLKVIEQRPLSDRVVTQLDIPHQSPQVFVIRNGRCTWNASHADINEWALDQKTAGTPTST